MPLRKSLALENRSTITKKIAILIIKLFISVLLLYFFISKIGTKTIIDNVKLLSPIAFIAAVFMYIVATYLSSLRWNLLIPYNMKTKRLFSLYMIGSFFNTYMPGIVGGDAIKAYYLSRELQNIMTDCKGQNKECSADSILQPAISIPHSTVAVASVFMDRYIGFSALLCISIIAFPFGYNYLEGTPVKWLMPIVLGVFILGSVIIFKFRIGERFKFLLRVYEYFRIYSKKRGTILKAFVYSVFIQIGGIVSVYVLSKGISLDIPFLSLMIFVPIIILISFIPISVSGIGLREGAFVIFLGTIGVSPDLSITLSILWFFSVVVASLWGLFEYLHFKPMSGSKEE